MYRFLFNSIRNRNWLAVVLLLAVGLSFPMSAGAGKKKKADARVSTRGGAAEVWVRPDEAGVAEPAEHRSRALDRLLCRGKDRLHAGGEQQAESKLDGPACGRTVRCGEGQSQDVSRSR